MKPRTILVNPPWGALAHPGIQVGLLKACLEQRGLPCDVAYANLWLLERLSYSDYLDVCEEYSFLGEWLFSGVLFGDVRGPDGKDFWDAFIRRYPQAVERYGDAGALMRERRERLIPAFVEDCARRLDWGRYSVVGFSCTFDQVVPSLALSKAIKALHPSVTIVLGGSQMDGPMGPAYQRAFPWVDYVVRGEAEEALPALVEALAAGRKPAGIPGVDLPAAAVQDIGRFPFPDYDGYFEELDRLYARGAVVPKPSLLVETAKGCWWGERSHCVFCSLNDQTISFRAKSAERVEAELRAQSARHRAFSFRAVDSIFDRSFFEGLLPRLRDLDLDFYFEAKADLSLERLRAMAQAGVKEFLIGIDSLSTDVLRLMRKGGTMLQNVQLLKWARRAGIKTEWALLHRCPGETPAMYEEMTRLIPKLAHLEPPRALWKLKLLRFSPFHERPADFGISRLRPADLYGYIFPRGSVDLAEAAFMFDADWEADSVSDGALGPLRAAVEAWRAADRQGRTLSYRRGAGFIEVVDARAPSGRRDHRLVEGWQAELYDYCDAIRTRGDLLRFAAARGVAPGRLDAALSSFVEQGLMLCERSSHLSLAQPAGQAGAPSCPRTRAAAGAGEPA